MKATVFEFVNSAVEELGIELGNDLLRAVTVDTPLFGSEHGIDSLSLVRLIAEIERKAEARLGRRLILADDHAMSRRRSPFRTVGTLTELVQERTG